SGSMGSRLGSGGRSRWQGLANALTTALPPVDATMEIGALLYPSSGAGRDLTCSVSASVNLAPATGNVDPLLQLVRDTVPGGATPTADAVDVAARSVLAFRAATTARTMVLATDGAPNCNASLDPRTCRSGSGPNSRTGSMCLDDVRTVDRIRSYAAS